uniref:Uncharacterized protein n=1 Tax=Setaria italica TaxID=4555 RepID=K3ZBK6_SETIT
MFFKNGTVFILNETIMPVCLHDYSGPYIPYNHPTTIIFSFVLIPFNEPCIEPNQTITDGHLFSN